MMLSFIQTLTEAADASPRIAHPEDSIFDGLADAQRYVTALKQVINNPGSVSIKWDGGIALIFGYTPAGEFYINDKYMPEGYYARSPKDWELYDTTVKKSRTARPELYPKIATIWDGLRADVVSKGTYKGDLMSVGQTPLVNGMYEFTPTTVKYRIPPKSPIGALIAKKVGIVVVHQANGAPWDGKTGLANNGNVAVLNPTAGISFTLNDPVQLSTAATRAVTGPAGAAAEQFLTGLDGVARAAIKKYFNHKITGQTTEELIPWLEHGNVSAKQFKLLAGDENAYLYANDQGYQSLRAVWNAIYAFKVNLADQLESQVRGFEQWTGGQKAGEGFVVNTNLGLIKLVNRGVFGAAHFNK
jgi:hypothetical protein